MTSRIVVHAGFHKTGTTSVQTMLRANRRRLKPALRIYLKRDFEALTRAARAFSVAPGEDSLVAVRAAAASFFADVDRTDPRPVVLSSEDLSGHLPGRHGLDRYDAAALIMSQIADAAYDAFGAELDLTFFFSTRGRDRWLQSTWWQNLRVTRLTDDLPRYSETVAAAADLPAVVAEVAAAVAPAQVASMPLEDSRETEFGPLTPVIDLLDLPSEVRARIETVPPENVQPDLGLNDVFLALNRSGLRDRQVSDAKRSLRRMAEHVEKRDKS